MLKYLLLHMWNNLSDPEIEDALKDRISSRKSVGLSFTDKTPDESTFVKFRARLREAGIHDAFFDAVVRHIERQDRQARIDQGRFCEPSMSREGRVQVMSSCSRVTRAVAGSCVLATMQGRQDRR